MRRVLEYLCPILLPPDGGGSDVICTAVDLDHMTLSDVVCSSVGDPQDVRQNRESDSIAAYSCGGGANFIVIAIPTLSISCHNSVLNYTVNSCASDKG